MIAVFFAIQSTQEQEKKVDKIIDAQIARLRNYYFSCLIFFKFDESSRVAPWEGIEPPTNWLTANCSTAELPRNSKYFNNFKN